MPTPIFASTAQDWNGQESLVFTRNGVSSGSALLLLNSASHRTNVTDPVFAVSDGVSYTKSAYEPAPTRFRSVGIFRRMGLSAADYTVTISHTAGIDTVYGHAMLIEVAGLVNGAPGTAGENSGELFDGSTQAITSGSTGTLAVAANMVFAICHSGLDPGPSTLTTPSGYTSLLLHQGTSGFDPAASFAWKDTAATTAENPSWGNCVDTYYWAATAIPFPKTVGGGSNVNLFVGKLGAPFRGKLG